LSNSTILQTLNSLGVNLYIFYELLWRHVLTIEILRHRFNVQNEDDKVSMMLQLRSMLPGSKYARPIRYLEEWGKNFWEDTEYRIREITQTLEDSVASSLGVKSPALRAELSAADKMTEQRKIEVVQRATNVVNNVQIQALSELLKMLDDLLTNRQQPHYVVIDGLDEAWVDDRVRYRLIRALLETVRSFRQVRHAKVIVALRSDLLERVTRETREAGWQEEKLKSLYLRMYWTEPHLADVLNSRINKVIQRSYTKQKVAYSDVMPDHVGGKPVLRWMLERTMMRPRDIISFFNTCIPFAEGKAQFSQTVLRSAEGDYSRDRLRALADEWSADYPNLAALSALLRKQNYMFRLEDLKDEVCDEVCLRALTEEPLHDDVLREASDGLVERRISHAQFRQIVIKAFYHVGLVGLAPSGGEAISWSTNTDRSVSIAEIEPTTRVYVHPFAWRTLGIRPPKGNTAVGEG
jgi:hypothetical protein